MAHFDWSRQLSVNTQWNGQLIDRRFTKAETANAVIQNAKSKVAEIDQTIEEAQKHKRKCQKCK